MKLSELKSFVKDVLKEGTQLKEAVSHKFSDKPYQMYFVKNNMRQATGSNKLADLLNYAKENNLDNFEIFKNGSGFHSTTQDEFLLYWKGDGTYFDNRSKREPELLSKKIK